MGLLDAVTKPFDWFIAVVPAPLKIVLFLLIIVLFGGLISNTFLSNRYNCDENALLVDDREFLKCSDEFIAGWVWKWNLSQDQCYNLPESSDPVFNNTVCDIILPDMQEITWGRAMELGIQGNFNVWGNWFSGIYNHSSVSILSYIADPSRALCGGFHDCLSPDYRILFNTNPECTLTRGDNIAEPNFPTIQEYMYLSRVNKSVQAEDIDKFSVFSVQCFDFGDEDGIEPEVAFLGLPVLRYELWLVFIIIALFVWLIKVL